MVKNELNADRSELLATYDNYGKELIVIDSKEYYANLNAKTYNEYTMGCSDVQRYSIDGYDFICYSTVYNVGWQGDVDCDSFYCKIKTLTAKEIEEFCNIFS
jgi:hypothetical protein